jgi:hypothetical protein
MSGCVHRVAVRRGPDFSIFESGGVRVYLESAFQKGFIGMKSEAEFRQFFEKTKCEVGVLLERGLLTGRMFFDALSDVSPESGVIHLVRRKLTEIDMIMADDPGPLVKILYYEDLSDLKVPTHRTYDLWVAFSASETGWGSFDHFSLELENTKAKAQTSGCEFSKGARVVKLTYTGTEL